MSDQNYTLPIIFFLLALVFGFLALVSKELWRDKQKTQFFAVLAIMGTFGFVAWALKYL